MLKSLQVPFWRCVQVTSITSKKKRLEWELTTRSSQSKETTFWVYKSLFGCRVLTSQLVKMGDLHLVGSEGCPEYIVLASVAFLGYSSGSLIKLPASQCSRTYFVPLDFVMLRWSWEHGFVSGPLSKYRSSKSKIAMGIIWYLHPQELCWVSSGI